MITYAEYQKARAKVRAVTDIIDVAIKQSILDGKSIRVQIVPSDPDEVRCVCDAYQRAGWRVTFHEQKDSYFIDLEGA